MTSYNTLLEKFVAENKCRPTLADALVPKVIAWVEKNTKINVSDRGSAAVRVLKQSAGGALGGHKPLDGRRRRLVAGCRHPGCA